MGEPKSNDNAMLHDGEMIARNKMISSSELVHCSEMLHGDNMVQESEIVHGDEMVISGNEMVHGNEMMIHGNEMVQVNDIIHSNEMAQVNNMVIGDEMAHGNALVSADVSLPTSSRRRKKKSPVWEHFTIQHVPGDKRCRIACCNLCKGTFAYSSGAKIAGTSHLKRHIIQGSCPVIKNQERELALPLAEVADNVGEGTIERPSKRRYR